MIDISHELKWLNYTNIESWLHVWVQSFSDVIAGANIPSLVIGVRLRGDCVGERQTTNNSRVRIVLQSVLIYL